MSLNCRYIKAYAGSVVQHTIGNHRYGYQDTFTLKYTLTAVDNGRTSCWLTPTGAFVRILLEVMRSDPSPLVIKFLGIDLKKNVLRIGLSAIERLMRYRLQIDYDDQTCFYLD